MSLSQPSTEVKLSVLFIVTFHSKSCCNLTSTLESEATPQTATWKVLLSAIYIRLVVVKWGISSLNIEKLER